MSSFSFHLPFLGELYVSCVSTHAFRGRIFQAEIYRGECLFRILFLHGIYTPPTWKPTNEPPERKPD